MFKKMLLGLLLGLPPLIAVAESELELPPEVVAALEADDCRDLMRLNRAYWQALREEAGDDSTAVLEAGIGALEAAILAQPWCGETTGLLLDARREEGVDVFGFGGPGGFRL